MIKNFDEVPRTIEGIRFFIMAGEKSLKELRNRANKLEVLISEAKERLDRYEGSLKKEVMQ